MVSVMTEPKQNGKSTLTRMVGWETITPSQAKRYLKDRFPNRRVAEVRVGSYARDMETGRWGIVSEPVIFIDGKLYRGQHRCQACIEAGVPFETLVVHLSGKDAESVQQNDTSDTGRTRTFANDLAIAEQENGMVVAASARLVWGYKHASPLQTPQPTKSELKETLSQYSSLTTKSWLLVANRCKNSPTRLNNSAVNAFTALLLEAGIPEGDIRWFLKELIDVADLEKGTAIHSMFMWATRNQGSRSGAKSPLSKIYLIALIKTWNAYIEARPVALLRIGGTEMNSWPEISTGY